MRAVRMIQAIDTHTEGMPTRVVVGGVGALPGDSMGARRDWAINNLDDLRGLLMREPHGHSAMSGAILQPPTRDDADWGVLYIETTGFLPMCGHGTIGVATALVETGMVEVIEPLTVIRLETPAGLVEAQVHVADGKAVTVSIVNVPSFVLEERAVVEVSGLGSLEYAMVYGGNFYPVVEAADVGLPLELENAPRLIDLGLRVVAAVNAQRRPVHPMDSRINGIHHVQFVEPGTSGADTRNAVVNVPGYFDRSPCGTGTSAVMALRHHRGALATGDSHVNESMIGTRFTGTVLDSVPVDGRTAIVPRITGRAWLTGFSQHLLDPSDPFPSGFTI